MTSPDKNPTLTETPDFQTEEGPQDLAAQREERGLSLEEVFAGTRISIKTLSAIERGDFSLLPHPVYTKAFIKQYAAFIGVDPQPIMARYEAYLNAQDEPRPAKKSEKKDSPSQGFKLRKLLWPVACAVIVLVALWLYLYNPYGWQPVESLHDIIAEKLESPVEPTTPTPTVSEPGQPETITDAATVAPLTPQPETPAEPASRLETNPPPPPAAPAADTSDISASGLQKMTIIARETTWVAIRIDEQEEKQVLLQPGDTVTYAGTAFRMDVGNGGGIDVTLQGKTLPPLGKRGQVVHVTLP
ncbi:MAG: helix-turn-helix domain-containing protein [Syntrophaceae bacterium]|nr:helix-turn-helix domain-containing protein [Syntrophaceae bacterium]